MTSTIQEAIAIGFWKYYGYSEIPYGQTLMLKGFKIKTVTDRETFIKRI